MKQLLDVLDAGSHHVSDRSTFPHRQRAAEPDLLRSVQSERDSQTPPFSMM